MSDDMNNDMAEKTDETPAVDGTPVDGDAAVVEEKKPEGEMPADAI